MKSYQKFLQEEVLTESIGTMNHLLNNTGHKLLVPGKNTFGDMADRLEQQAGKWMHVPGSLDKYYVDRLRLNPTHEVHLNADGSRDVSPQHRHEFEFTSAYKA